MDGLILRFFVIISFWLLFSVSDLSIAFLDGVCFLETVAVFQSRSTFHILWNGNRFKHILLRLGQVRL